MKTQQHTIHYQVCQEEELSATDKALVTAAKSACSTSYSPYSHFSVGAAVALENGEIICGSNQENASYPATTCAERCAMFYANARYPETPAMAIAIAARGTDGEFTSRPIPPCGICRQVLIETQKRYQRPLRVLLYGKEETICLATCSDLLPFQFDSENLVP